MFRPTSPYLGNTTVYGTREKKIINFMLITSGQLVHIQEIQLYTEHVRK